MKAISEPVTRAAVPVVTNVQIICGDCGGDALFPLKTLLTSDGYCSRCAGRNYVLASRLRVASIEEQGEKTDPH